jgi:two-component system phosphate regulon sensor histidine kinase PhoR
LLDNATQYTPRGGRIWVEARVTTVAEAGKGAFSGVVVTVGDTGIGIPQSDQQRIFERFYRVDAARSREAGGTGLGLAITKHLVELHGGRIWVESEVGRGSQFHFSVPVAA